ncbi:hypothetical protein ABPG72_020389 [Tetrahymena utriculariae]
MDITQNTNYYQNQLPCQCKFKYTSEYLNIQSVNEDDVFACLNCTVQYKMSRYLPISNIIQDKKQKTFENWPILDDDESIKQLQEFLFQQNPEQQLNKQIETFFEDFEKEFIKVLIEQKKIILIKQNSISQDTSNLFEYYQSIAQLDDLKNIILDQQQTKSQKANQILQIITNKKQDSTKNTNNFEIKKNENLSNILKLISNKTNFCSQKYLESVQSELIKIQDFMEFNEFNPNQIENIEILCNKISELNIQSKQENQKGNNFDIFTKLQPSSSLIVNNIIKFDDRISKQKQDNNEKLLRNYPIFEIEQIVKQQPCQFQMEISNLNDSKLNSKLTYDQDGNQRFESIQNSHSNSYVKIKQDHLYRIVIKLDLNSSRWLCIGLIQKAHKDSQYVHSNNIINSFSIKDDRGVSKPTKGKCLRDLKYPDELNQIQITFCVKKKFFQVCDYPNKENINDINDDKLNLIDINQDYYLGFDLYYKGESITILHFEELQIQV